jgi:H+/Cl- antiporter ClcA
MAVIAVEITGNIRWLFPALIAATAACGITQRLGLGLYDQAMVNRG